MTQVRKGQPRVLALIGRAALALALLLAPLVGARAADSQVPAVVETTRTGDLVALKGLLRRPGVNVNAAEADGTTALHYAAQRSDLAQARVLIKAGATVNARNRYGIAPIWLAATNGDAAMVEVLLRTGADANTTRADSGETVLMTAAMAGNPAVVQRLLAYGADPNAKDVVREQTALMWAAAESHGDAARVLVDAGAQIETRSSTGISALMFAIRAGDISGTLTLLDLGASLTATAPDGTTSLGLAIINAHWELAAKLVERGADVNGDDPRGRPLQMVAFMRRANNRGLSAWLPRRPTGTLDSMDFAKLLLAKGARLNDRVNFKNGMLNPSHMAVGYFNMTNWNGATPLYIAAKGCDVEFIRFLLSQGADPSINTAQGISPLLIAAGIGFATGESPGTHEEAFESVKLLAAAGNDVKAVAKLGASGGMGGGWDGATALHGAVIRGATALVEWLIARDVPLDAKAAGDRTALDHARGSTLGVNFKVQPELAEMLEKAMRARGLPIPEYKYGFENEQGGAVPPGKK